MDSRTCKKKNFSRNEAQGISAHFHAVLGGRQIYKTFWYIFILFMKFRNIFKYSIKNCFFSCARTSGRNPALLAWSTRVTATQAGEGTRTFHLNGQCHKFLFFYYTVCHRVKWFFWNKHLTFVMLCQSSLFKLLLFNLAQGLRKCWMLP